MALDFSEKGFIYDATNSLPKYFWVNI